jgi:hypothetical protein
MDLESGKTGKGDHSPRFLKIKAKNRSYITCHGGSVLKPGEIDRNVMILEVEQTAKDKKKKKNIGSFMELPSPDQRPPGPALQRLDTITSITTNPPQKPLIRLDTKITRVMSQSPPGGDSPLKKRLEELDSVQNLGKQGTLPESHSLPRAPIINRNGTLKSSPLESTPEEPDGGIIKT